MVRDLLPIERISEACIRDVLGPHPQVGGWSRGRRGIRPFRLAHLVRDRIWTAHDSSAADLLHRLRQRQPGNKLRYEVDISIETEGGPVTVAAWTEFGLTGTGGMTARLYLKAAERQAPISSVVRLEAPAALR
ncbi:MAG: hypothetical protein QOH86_707 [Sphingomonadales bacterium]|nr:hypothetical protein [Sphingomonadales bacterium]